MDALKYVLHAVRLEPHLFRRHEIEARAYLPFTATTFAAYHLIEQGVCRLETGSHAQRLATGDLIVVTNTRRYELAAEAGAASVTVISGEFRAEHAVTIPIFSLLPPLIYIPAHNSQPIYWLATALRGIASEAHGARPGYEAVVSRLLDILFIMVMRSWIDGHPAGGGWLGALYDPYLGQALNAIHSDPGKMWTVKGLAQVAGLSRSVFAERFGGMVGEPPMRYLTRWRMQLATTWLSTDPLLTLEHIAARLGYTSPFAFSKAFKRLTGYAPSVYRRLHQGLPSA